MNPVIELDGLGVRFGRHQILKDLRGDLRGRAIGLLGPNGAGKTTLVHTLLGFHQATEGTARVLGHDIKETAAIRSGIGYMPENDAFIAGMSAVRLVRLMAELSGLPPREALERAHEALFYVGLGEARYRNVETYSLGMKQMAKLAQAIVHGPRLLFLDEPTNGLDPPHRRRMLDLIREIKQAGEVRIVLSSHLLKDVEEVCDEVLILKQGQVARYCDLEAERQANRKFIEIETTGSNAVFASEIAKLGCDYALDGDKRLKTVLPQGVEIRDLYRVAADHQIRIRRLDYRRDSLKDIFLRAMESNRGGL
ncbi:MAG TPA: ABC transporter ATP-binding protein [Candidatus Polarisedimenticolaceae bacterium]|nr:ABC transporter ATP-binding protein [Candidatus Polarisedimenticolaceae bacterium]